MTVFTPYSFKKAISSCVRLLILLDLKKVCHFICSPYFVLYPPNSRQFSRRSSGNRTQFNFAFFIDIRFPLKKLIESSVSESNFILILSQIYKIIIKKILYLCKITVNFLLKGLFNQYEIDFNEMILYSSYIVIIMEMENLALISPKKNIVNSCIVDLVEVIFQVVLTAPLKMLFAGR